MVSALSAPHFHNEEAAFAYVEARVWPEGPTCPHCGGVERIGKMGGKSTRLGLYKCYQCRKPFTVRIGTIFESSHVALHIWLQAMYLIAGSKKGISSNQLHRTLGVTLKTAWFMSHRIREAMRSGDLTPFGSDGGIVEADETYIGHKKDEKTRRAGGQHKMKVLSLVDRESGAARSYVLDTVNLKEVAPILDANISREAHLMTDEHRVYRGLGWNFAAHSAVAHTNGQYAVPGSPELHTNTIEGFFSIFKRGMNGVYQHCQEKHLHRYLAEFDFRYTNRQALGCNDGDRADKLLAGIVGKRLTYQQSGQRV
ncbi:IS1595 family transposase [Sphingopyxis granuli]|uniref:IS1595 family transposase n=1 Tax=Sphingopyxis granuli TaxID=267128 RepID=UPI001F52E4A9|nr:IS1595 family transposase [Sphingopyxis granuli]UNK81291.1 IS1595 family transposase [Sphingopyxis granuli]